MKSYIVDCIEVFLVFLASINQVKVMKTFQKVNNSCSMYEQMQGKTYFTRIPGM